MVNSLISSFFCASYLACSKHHHHLEQQQVKSSALEITNVELAPALHYLLKSFALASTFKSLCLSLLICETGQVTADKYRAFPSCLFLG